MASSPLEDSSSSSSLIGWNIEVGSGASAVCEVLLALVGRVRRDCNRAYEERDAARASEVRGEAAAGERGSSDAAGMDKGIEEGEGVSSSSAVKVVSRGVCGAESTGASSLEEGNKKGAVSDMPRRSWKRRDLHSMSPRSREWDSSPHGIRQFIPRLHRVLCRRLGLGVVVIRVWNRVVGERAASSADMQ